jgi:hypothetical protein
MRDIYRRLLRGQHQVRLGLSRSLAVAQRLVSDVLLFTVRDYDLKRFDVSNRAAISGEEALPCEEHLAFRRATFVLRLRGRRCTRDARAHLHWQRHPCLQRKRTDSSSGFLSFTSIQSLINKPFTAAALAAMMAAAVGCDGQAPAGGCKLFYYLINAESWFKSRGTVFDFGSRRQKIDATILKKTFKKELKKLEKGVP